MCVWGGGYTYGHGRIVGNKQAPASLETITITIHRIRVVGAVALTTAVLLYQVGCDGEGVYCRLYTATATAVLTTQTLTLQELEPTIQVYYPIPFYYLAILFPLS